MWNHTVDNERRFGMYLVVELAVAVCHYILVKHQIRMFENYFLYIQVLILPLHKLIKNRILTIFLIHCRIVNIFHHLLPDENLIFRIPAQETV